MKRNFTISGFFLLFILFVNTAFAQNITIKGKVTDATTGEALIGVSVGQKGTTTGTQTDASGLFALSVTPNSIVQLTYVGYATQQITAAAGTINIKLVPTANDLQQVVVIGYGTQRKLDNTGAVSNVKGTEIAKQATQNTLSALQGKVAGVTITNSGQPGSSPQVAIRGIGTIYGTQNPLYVVDGVWYDDISFLNNADITSLTVLKDASSLAIFGIRAANGAILITTKKGTIGKPTINYNAYVGFQAVTNLVKMADATEYATAINELYAANNITPPLFADPASYGKGTDWYRQILRNAFVTNHQISINGGTEKYKYYYSFGYLDQDGLVKTNNYQRYTVRAGNDIQLLKTLKVGFDATGQRSISKDAPGGIFHQLYGAAPTLPVFYSTGAYGDPNDYHTGDGNNYNPQATLDFNNSRSTNIRATGNAYGELSILKNLVFRTSIGGDIAQAEQREFTPIYDATLAQKSTVTNLSINHTETRNWIWENTLTYNYKKNGHSLTALAGFSRQGYITYFSAANAQGVPYSKGNIHTSFPDTASVNRSIVTADQQPHTTFESEFARLNYSYKDRYLFNATVRRDGASQFHTATQSGYATFPALGAGWVISNESFMKDQHIFDNLKIRGSWGKTGNAVVPINPTQVLVDNNPALTAIFGNPQQAYQGQGIDAIAYPTITYEKTTGTDFGIEGAFLHNKLSFEADYYNKNNSDAIFPIPVLASIGTASGTITSNQANIRNRGFEVSLNWKDQVTKDFSYSIGINGALNNNVVLNVITGKNPIYAGGNGIANGQLATRTVEGQPIGEFYGYKVTGIFQDAAQVSNSPQTSAKPGDFIYEDVNKDGIIDSRDRVNLGNPNPKYTYGVNTSFAYKNFDLAIDLQGVADVDVYNANIAYRFGNENFTQDFYEHRWHGPGTSNSYPSVNVGATDNAKPNSFYVESGAYFRVRNMQLGYTLPGAILSNLGLSKIRFYANAQNAINLFGYKGFTPEVGGGFGNNGIDASVYPLYATYNFGVNVTF